jgi:hypothetical protein
MGPIYRVKLMLRYRSIELLHWEVIVAPVVALVDALGVEHPSLGYVIPKVEFYGAGRPDKPWYVEEQCTAL